MIRYSFFESAIDMGPAACEHDSWTRSCAGFVRTKRIGDDHTSKIADERAEGRRALIVANAIDHDARSGQRPHLPRLGGIVLESWPTSLVEPDHGLLEHVFAERSVDDREPLRDRVGEVP